MSGKICPSGCACRATLMNKTTDAERRRPRRRYDNIAWRSAWNDGIRVAPSGAYIAWLNHPSDNGAQASAAASRDAVFIAAGVVEPVTRVMRQTDRPTSTKQAKAGVTGHCQLHPPIFTLVCGISIFRSVANPQFRSPIHGQFRVRVFVALSYARMRHRRRRRVCPSVRHTLVLTQN